MSKPIRIRVSRAFDPPAIELLEKRWPETRGINRELEIYVESIIKEVRERGDKALIEFTNKFDGVELTSSQLRVTEKEVKDAYGKVDESQISAIEFAKSRLEIFEKELLGRINFEVKDVGIEIYSRTSPIRSVGCYVPGGEAAYPSTVIMTVTPAKVAGVSRIVVSSPPKKGGEVNPLTLVAADLCGADEIYRVGGIQAIAALAYGTETIKPVEKIVGPGNRYIVAAKALVSIDVPIDLPAGPSEIAILADESADPRIVALDMISQAEHDSDAIPILVTTSRNLAERVVDELEGIVNSAPRREIVSESLFRKGLVVVCQDIEEAISFINEFASEHLEVMMEDSIDIADKIKSAGLLLLGRYTPVSASDYCLGTNHVLPTGGFVHVFSGLSVLNFVKRVNTVQCSKKSLLRIKDNVKVLAEAEGLFNHALAVEERFRVE